MTRLLMLLLRRHGRWCGVWVGLVGVLSLSTVSAYASAYPTEAARQAAVQLARHSDTTLLYGRLRDPGMPGQMFAWEMGAFLTLLVSVMAVLLGVRLTRTAEEDGTLEVIRACGLGPRDPLLAGLLTILGTAVALGGATALGIGAHAGRVPGVDWPGAVVLGAVIALTFLLVALLVTVIAQCVPTARAARALGAVCVALALAIRAAADIRSQPALEWVSPLALREITEPFGRNRILALLPILLESLALGGIAVLLQIRREFGSSLFRVPAWRPRRLHIDSPMGLAWRLHRGPLAWWLVSVATGNTLMTAMGSGVVTSARRGQLGRGFLADQLGGSNPAAAYFAYTATLVGITVSVLAIVTVLRCATDEAQGLQELLRAAGCRPDRPLRAQLMIALLGSLSILLTTAAAAAIVAPKVISGQETARDAFTAVLAQWPAVAALAGLAALAVGALPRHAWLTWVPFAAGVVGTVLGRLLELPKLLVDLSVFGHINAGTAPTTGLPAQAALLAVSALTAAAALIAVRHRDAVVG